MCIYIYISVYVYMAVQCMYKNILVYAHICMCIYKGIVSEPLALDRNNHTSDTVGIQRSRRPKVQITSLTDN